VRQHSKPLLGLAYLLVIAMLLWVSIATYRKEMPWQAAVNVTLTTNTPGLELNPGSDVKLQGLIVGFVRRITSDGHSARIELALDPDKRKLIPANVDAAIVPKTLFGEKFVDLKVPAQPVTARIADGGVIKQSSTSVEIGKLFSNLVPVLRTLRPEQVSTLLNSMADALDGRGAKLGETVEVTRAFLNSIEPELGTLTHDIRQFGETANLYADAAPELLRVLANTSAISKELLLPAEKRFAAFLDNVISTATTTTNVLKENTEHIVTLSGRSRPVLALLDEYAIVLPCLINDLAQADKVANQGMGARGPFANLSVDMVVTRKPYKYPDDLPTNPRSEAHPNNLPSFIPGWAPHCAVIPQRVRDIPDAAPYSLDPIGHWMNPKSPRVAPGTATSTGAPSSLLVDEARSGLARVLAAQSLGVPQDEVPGYVSLLLGPLMSDGQVTVR
jgi:phospholipid/cholesterol/gamma-HCH transport system substrate-binding protein